MIEIKSNKAIQTFQIRLQIVVCELYTCGKLHEVVIIRNVHPVIMIDFAGIKQVTRGSMTSD